MARTTDCRPANAPSLRRTPAPVQIIRPNAVRGFCAVCAATIMYSDRARREPAQRRREDIGKMRCRKHGGQGATRERFGRNG